MKKTKLKDLVGATINFKNNFYSERQHRIDLLTELHKDDIKLESEVKKMFKEVESKYKYIKAVNNFKNIRQENKQELVFLGTSIEDINNSIYKSYDEQIAAFKKASAFLDIYVSTVINKKIEAIAKTSKPSPLRVKLSDRRFNKVYETSNNSEFTTEVE